MSTHNMGFYEGIEKIIFQLSLNITKYALYLFFWKKAKCMVTNQVATWSQLTERHH